MLKLQPIYTQTVNPQRLTQYVNYTNFQISYITACRFLSLKPTQIPPSHSNHFSDRILRVPSGEQILGPVHDPAMAGQAGIETCQLHPRAG